MRSLFPLILIGASAGVFFLLTDPLLSEMKKVQAEVRTYDGALNNANKLVEARSSLTKKRNSFPSDGAERLSKFIPDAVDNVRLLIDMNGIAARFQMPMKNVRIVTSGDKSDDGSIGPEKKKYGTVSLSFTVAGTYDTFRLFLAELERSLRLVDITSVTFSSSDKDLYDYSLGMQTYWLK